MPRARYIPPSMRNQMEEVKNTSHSNSEVGLCSQEQQPLNYGSNTQAARFVKDYSMDHNRNNTVAQKVYGDDFGRANGQHWQTGKMTMNGYGVKRGGNYGLSSHSFASHDIRYQQAKPARGHRNTWENGNRNYGSHNKRNHGGYGEGTNGGSNFRGNFRGRNSGRGGHWRWGGNRRGGRPRGRFSNTPKDAQTVEDPQYELEIFGKKKEQPTGIKFDQYDKIPVEVSGSDVAPAVQSFEESGLHERLLRNIALSGYLKPTPVQKHSIPIVAGFRDLMSCAQTGSGKTAAFLLPVINILITHERPPLPDDFPSRMPCPMALVLSPTRELAQQIHRECRKFLYCTGLRSVCVYGGSDSRSQYRELELGVAVLVATPGRLADFLHRNKLSLYICKFTILDEADRMLDLGFEPQIQEIIEAFDMPNERHTMMFSATFPVEIQKLAQKYLTNYIFLAVGRVGSATETITQELTKANGRDQKLEVLMDLLPRCDGLTLVFVATRRDAESIEYFLRSESVNAESIHGNRNQYERERALKAFRDGVSPILIATDVAARGLDVPNVKWVINYDLPTTIDSYVHRIGRTGRCGNTGTAISLVGNKENKNVIRELHNMLQESKQAVPVWFSNMVAASMCGGSSWHKSNRNRQAGSQYGGRDIRRENRNAQRQKKLHQNWRRPAKGQQNSNSKDSW